MIVYLHWGTELQDCPNPLQEPLAQLLVKAGADIVVGTHAHVLLGGGYLGSAYVDYGLGNFAFYDNSPPENASGSLVITATGRHIDSVRWRPAVIEDDLLPASDRPDCFGSTCCLEPGAVLHGSFTATPGRGRSPQLLLESAPPSEGQVQQLSQDTSTPGPTFPGTSPRGA